MAMPLFDINEENNVTGEKIKQQCMVGDKKYKSIYKALLSQLNTFDKLFDLGEPLGQGEFGMVYKTYLKSRPEEPYAAKMCDISKFKEKLKKIILKNWQIEVKKLQQIQHPMVNKIVKAFKSGDIIITVQELIPGKTLRQLLEERRSQGLKGFDEDTVAKITI